MNDEQKLEQSEIFKQRADEWVKVCIRFQFLFDINTGLFSQRLVTMNLLSKDIKPYLTIF